MTLAATRLNTQGERAYLILLRANEIMSVIPCGLFCIVAHEHVAQPLIITHGNCINPHLDLWVNTPAP